MFISLQKFVRAVQDWTARLILGALILLIIFQIIGRYMFGFSIAQIEEVARLLQVYLGFVGAAIAYRHGYHIKITDFRFRNPIADRAYRCLSAATVAIVMIVFCFGAVVLLELGQFQTSPATQMPLYVNYMAIYLGAFLLMTEIIAGIVSVSPKD